MTILNTHQLSVKGGGELVDALPLLDQVTMVVEIGQKVSKVWHFQVHLLDELLHLGHTEG